MKGSKPARARIMAVGLVVVALYLVGAAVSGRMSPTARRPLLDGIGPPQPYQWVSPPPSLAAGNKPAEPGTVTLQLKASGTVGGVVSTRDLQVTLIFKDGAFSSAQGATGVDVVVTPLDPGTLGAPPTDLVTTGNAYRITASYGGVGSSGPAPKLANSADLSMVYPSTPTSGFTHVDHVILASPDGTSWSRVTTSDVTGALTAAAPVDALGFFVVAEPKSAARAGSTGRSYVPFIVAGIGVLLLLLSSPRVVGWIRRRRAGEGNGR